MSRLACDGDVWTIEFGGIVKHLSDRKGLDYLSQLLAQPGQPIPAVVLQRREPRGDDGTSERARLNVTRAIRSVLTRLDELHPALADHLKATIRTGNECCYRPDPRLPIRWRTGRASSSPQV